jgi:hypothetical protein
LQIGGWRETLLMLRCDRIPVMLTCLQKLYPVSRHPKPNQFRRLGSSFLSV